MESGEWRVFSNCTFILNSPFSILHSPFSILHSPFSILHSPFSTLHSQLSILNSPFSTLHFSTLHSQLSILNSPFSTLHSPFSTNAYLCPDEGTGLPQQVFLQIPLVHAAGRAVRHCIELLQHPPGQGHPRGLRPGEGEHRALSAVRRLRSAGARVRCVCQQPFVLRGRGAGAGTAARRFPLLHAADADPDLAAHRVRPQERDLPASSWTFPSSGGTTPAT